MRTLAVLRHIEIAFGDAPLLDDADFSVAAGQRIGLIGRNGTGKSTLLRILARRIVPDDGVCEFADGLRLAYLSQETVLDDGLCVREALVRAGLVSVSQDSRMHSQRMAALEAMLDRFGVDPDAPVAGASEGFRKRAALAAVLSERAELVILDEPTNHLDIGAIRLLENTLDSEIGPGAALVIVTHDRYFLNRLATQITELDRGLLRTYPGRFEAYEAAKSREMHAETLAKRRFDKFWAQEEVWIRKGIEARRTRNEGRVRRLEALRATRQARREAMASLQLQIEGANRSGKIVAELTDVCKAYGARSVISNLNFRLLRGDRLGIVGANGAGKTTLVRLLAGTLAPDTGTVRLGTRLKTAYFDQMREGLDEEKTVAENVADGDFVEIGGTRRHVLSYLSDFLFSPRRAASPVKSLSGGERNRLFLAKLFALETNFIILDEPTNDLDMDALGVLEEALQNYEGTLIVVSHDRAFLDNVVTELLVPEGNGRWHEFVGGWSDWERFSREACAAQAKEPPKKKSPPPKGSWKQPRGVRLSFAEKRRLESLPDEIASLETEREGLQAAMLEETFFKDNPPEAIRAATAELKRLEEAIASAYEDWERLEAKSEEARRDR